MRVRFPAHGTGRDAVLGEIASLCAADYSYAEGRVLHSICSEPLPVAAEAYGRALCTNLGDRRIFPGVEEMERATTRMLGDLLGCPEAAGSAVSGGTEANLLALFAARTRARRRGLRGAEVLVPQSVHYSIEKAAELLDVRLRFAKLDRYLRVDVTDMARQVTGRTIGLVATAGTSEFGAVDDVPAIAGLARRHGLYLHVDAASGGLLIPFARELGYSYPAFDFTVEGVDSIAVDPHKYGFAAIPSGHLLFRDEATRDLIDFPSHYVGTPSHRTVLGTRPGSGVASAYAAIASLGREGYRQIVEECLRKRDLLVGQLREAGFELLIPPELNIVGVRSADARRAMERLEAAGWLVSVSRRYDVLRVVVQGYHSEEHLRDFVQALQSVESPRRRSGDGADAA